jgi:hypothetical protein
MMVKCGESYLVRLFSSQRLTLDFSLALDPVPPHLVCSDGRIAHGSGVALSVTPPAIAAARNARLGLKCSWLVLEVLAETCRNP